MATPVLRHAAKDVKPHSSHVDGAVHQVSKEEARCLQNAAQVTFDPPKTVTRLRITFHEAEVVAPSRGKRLR